MKRSQMICVLAIGLFVATGCQTTCPAKETASLPPFDVETYSMLTVDPAEAVERGWSVNGLWTGFGQPQAVIGSLHVISGDKEYPVRYSYPSIAEYVKACHDAGVKAPATVTSIAGHPLQRLRFPEMEQGACVGADGKRAYWAPVPDASYFMCSNNPIYYNVMRTMLNEAIDADCDLITIDEVQGNEFCFFWSNQPGFCEHCIAAYKKYLTETYTNEELSEKFKIDSLDTLDFAKRFDNQRAKRWSDTDPLYREMWFLQERLNFDARKRLCDDLREHMKARGRMIPIFGNTPGAGLGDFNGYRLKTVKWAQVLDSIAFENSRGELLPQGKWVANERIAAAAYTIPPAVTTNYDPLLKMQADFVAKKNNRSKQLYGLFAESYANGARFVSYFQKRFSPETEGLWSDVSKGQRFVLAHKDLFENQTDRGANVAVLFIENEGQRYRTYSFFGIAQALAESSIPFDVLIDGGDGFVPIALTAEMLQKYPVVLIPQALELAESQKSAIETYVAQGGVAMIADPAGFGIAEGVQETPREKGRFVCWPWLEVPKQGKRDLPSAYFFVWDDAARKQIAETVNRHASPVLTVTPEDRTVSVYPYYQQDKKRMVLHVVNSDYDPETNTMRAKEGVAISVKKPSFYREGTVAQIVSPDGAEYEATLTPVVKGDFVEITIPKMDVYSLVVL